MSSEIFKRTLGSIAQQIVEGNFEVVAPDGCTDVNALRKRLAESREHKCNPLDTHEHARKILKRMIPPAVGKDLFPGL